MIVATQIRKIGFFPFVEDYRLPVEALRRKIDDYGPSKVSDALIVLPEAFNLENDYWTGEPCSPDEAILGKLQGVCRDYNMSFVAGAILKTSGSPTPPYSSAYRVDSTGFQELCRKRCGDGRHGSPRDGYAPHYTCCQEDEDCDGHNGKYYRNVSLTALICRDAVASHDGNSERRERLRKKMAGGVVPQIVCIPSHMKYDHPDGIASEWPSSYVVLANSFHGGPLSFVAKVDKGNPGSAAVRILETVAFEQNRNIVRVVNIE